MALRIRNFNNARLRPSAGEGNSAAPLNNSAIVEKVLGTATREIFFSLEKTPLIMLQ